MLIYILAGLATVIVIFLLVAALQPAAFRIVRSALISAPPAVVFARVDNLHTWQEFSPWAKLDPAVQNTYEGPDAGLGASFAWNGNAKVGQGRMTITASQPHERIEIRLDFQRPFKNTNIAEFLFQSEGGQTKVIWSMSGEKNLIMKAFGLVMNMDKLIGGEFEQGLASLKALAEAAGSK